MRFMTLSCSTRSRSIRLLTLFLGCGLAGWLLGSYNASFAVWLLTRTVILYLAWAGRDAIALSIVGVLVILWSATLFHHESVILVWSGIPLTSAQNWATELLFNWVFGMALTFKLAFAHQCLRSDGWNKTKTFCLLAIVTSVGLSLGQCSRGLLA